MRIQVNMTQQNVFFPAYRINQSVYSKMQGENGMAESVQRDRVMISPQGRKNRMMDMLMRQKADILESISFWTSEDSTVAPSPLEESLADVEPVLEPEPPMGWLEVIRDPLSLEGEVSGSFPPPQAVTARVRATARTRQRRAPRYHGCSLSSITTPSLAFITALLL